MLRHTLNRILHSVTGSGKKKHHYKHYSSSEKRYGRPYPRHHSSSHRPVYPPHGGSYHYGHKYYKGKYKSHSSS